ncbi:MAG: adenylate/guanylate cyclase domain-containing protein [Opitutaceae bacterium]
MLNQERITKLNSLANRALDDAEKIWGEVGAEICFANEKSAKVELREHVETQIPGYPTIEEGEATVDKFIAVVADMRDSTDHLMCAISPKLAKVSQLQRVFYETSVLLPCLAESIREEGGRVTEYLGDGVLAIFRVNKENEEDSIYSANRAAKNCLEVVDEVINPLLKERYSLPALEVGVGMACSKSVVTLVGLEGFRQPKVFGECVYRATKLSGGVNQIIVDKTLHYMWPTAKVPTISFKQVNQKGVDGYLVSRVNSLKTENGVRD